MVKCKFIIILISFIALLLLIVACGDNNNDDGGSFIENYIYLPQRINLPFTPNPILGATVHGEQLFYWYMEARQGDGSNPYDGESVLMVVELTADGNIIQEINIPLPDVATQIGSLHITEDNNIGIITTLRKADDGISVSYGVYNQQGINISTLDISHIVSRDAHQFIANRAVFKGKQGDGSSASTLEDGSFVLAATEFTHADFPTYTLYVLNIEGALLGKMEADHGSDVVRLKDGRVVILLLSDGAFSLQEIDFITGDWGNIHPLADVSVQSLLPAGAGQPYDLLINDGSYIIGYTLETATQTQLLGLIEAGISNLANFHVGFFSDNSFFALSTGTLHGGGNDDWVSDLSIFTRSPRADIQEQKTIITLGGIIVSDSIRQEVIRFNEDNPYYRIVIVDYWDTSDWHGSEAAQLRFQVDMVTGRGPDIVYNARAHSLDTMHIDSIFMTDLNPLIDADTELNRADFFPNFLNALIALDGTLPFLSTGFEIETMIAMQETASQMTPLTFEALLNQLHESDQLRPFGNWFLRDTFLMNAIRFSDGEFIDWENNTAHLNSDAFIQMLEIALVLPEEPLLFETWSDVEEVRRLHDGELLLYNYRIYSPYEFHYLFGMLSDNITIVGMPTPTGGRNVLKSFSGLGINALSPHQDAAWSFIRQLLLPDALWQFGLPLRIDKLEDRITEIMTPELFWEETDPALGAVEGEERPRRITMGMNDGVTFYIYAMREHEAAMFRELIKSADMFMRYDETISMIVREDSQAFFAGARTAQETARIIQNRVQRYLDEQG